MKVYIVMREYFIPYDEAGPYREVVLVTTDKAKADEAQKSDRRDYRFTEEHEVIE